jgi:hypothetical protein
MRIAASCTAILTFALVGHPLTSDGRLRRLPTPVRNNGATISGDGWTLKVAAGWVIREGPRPGDYEVVQQQ